MFLCWKRRKAVRGLGTRLVRLCTHVLYAGDHVSSCPVSFSQRGPHFHGGPQNFMTPVLVLWVRMIRNNPGNARACRRVGRPGNETRRSTLSPVDKPSAACSMQILYCKQGTLRTRSRTGVSETLLLNVVALEVRHRIVAIYVREFNWPTIRMMGVYTRGPRNCQNWAISAWSAQYCK